MLKHIGTSLRGTSCIFGKVKKFRRVGYTERDMNDPFWIYTEQYSLNSSELLKDLAVFQKQKHGSD